MMHMTMTRARWIAAGVVGLILLAGAAAVASERWLSDTAFGALESDEATQYAMRVTIALDYEVDLLQGFGATNSVWTDAYESLKRSDTPGFLEEFAPEQIKPVSDIDGVIGVGPDGTYRLGGLSSAAGPDFQPLPAALTEKATLKTLIDPAAAASAATCGVVVADADPYLYCSFRAVDNAGAGEAVGNLIYLKALDRARLAALSKTVGMPITLVEKPHAGEVSAIDSALGKIAVTTATVDADTTSLDVALPATDSRDVVLEFTRPRPIHATAVSWANKTMLVLGALLALIIAAVAYANKRAVSSRVRPLRETAEQIIRSGDRSLRIRSDDRSEIGALGAAVDSMLDSLAEREDEIAAAQRERDEDARRAADREREREAETREQVSRSIGAASGAIGVELDRIRDNTADLRSAANSIEELVANASTLTRSVRRQTETASRAVGELGDSLQSVAGVAEMIAGVARQTNLLALNATIEAARAGDAGKGFGVVAGEVKELANATSAATADITATIDRLRSDAAAMSTAISEVRSGMADIDEATGEVRAVTGGQRETAEMLNGSVDHAIERLRGLTAAG